MLVRNFNGRGSLNLKGLAARIRDGSIACKFAEELASEKRYWGVADSEDDILTCFISHAVKDYRADFGVAPSCVFLMANVVWRGDSGSGGGWHLDSLLPQAKSFLYLTDVDHQTGPFQYCQSPGVVKKSVLLANRLVTGGNRLADWLIKFTFKNHRSVTGEAGTYFYTRTNIPHRGAPVLRQERIAVTCYMFTKPPLKYRDFRTHD
jgi:hypothetical protein